MKPIPVAQAAQLCQDIYAPVTQHSFDRLFSAGMVEVGYSLIDGVSCFTFRGSACSEDWLRNFDAVPFLHPKLGTVHRGFLEGMEDTFTTLKPHMGKTVCVQGHSLGAAHAAIFAGLCAVNDVYVEQLTLLAPPRPGYQTRLRDLVQGNVHKKYAFVNGLDPVPHVPCSLPHMPWTHVAPLFYINEKPEGIEEILPVHYHSVALYVRGVKKEFP